MINGACSVQLRPVGLAKSAILAIAGCTLFVGNATSANSQGSYVIQGWGNDTCAKFLNAAPIRVIAYDTWVAGFITAYNALSPDVVNSIAGTDFDDILGEISKLCRAKPSEMFAEATSEALNTYVAAHRERVKTK
jgi:hypothetical protein